MSEIAELADGGMSLKRFAFALIRMNNQRMNLDR